MRKKISKDVDCFLIDYANTLQGYKRINFDRLKRNLLFKPQYFKIIKKNKDVFGLIHIEPQPWDSNHFGLKFAKINLILAKRDYSKRSDILKGLLKEVDKSDYDYIVLRWDADDLPVMHNLENAGYKFLIESVTLLHDLKKINIPNKKINVRKFKDEDIPTMIKLAKTMFKYDRFHADPELDTGKCDSLHSEWIKNCCNQKLADEVFVAEIDNQIAGFNACKIDKENRIGGIVLTGVSSDFRGIGVGSVLIDVALNFFKDNGVDLAEVRTESFNTPAVNLYQKSGFRISLIEKYYRKIKKN